MSHTHNRRGLRKLYSPVLAFKKSHRGEPNPIWLMIATAPFEVPVVLYFAVLGWWTLIQGVHLTPGSIAAVLPHWEIVSWAFTFAVGGTIALVGRYGQRFPIESAGLALLAAGFFTYAIVLIATVGRNGIFASGAYLALLTGCIIRIRVIVLDRKARRAAGQILVQNHNGDAPR